MAVGRVLALALGLFGGVAASQLPEFAQQYRQRLGGAIDELGRVVDRFDQNAQSSGLSRDQAIGKLSAEPDPLTRRQGEAMGDVVGRLGRLGEQRQAFAEAGPLRRIGVLVSGMDPTLARSTYLDFEPAVPATAEGVVAGGAGFLGVWGTLLVFGHFVRRTLGRRRSARMVAARRA